MANMNRKCTPGPPIGQVSRYSPNWKREQADRCSPWNGREKARVQLKAILSGGYS